MIPYPLPSDLSSSTMAGEPTSEGVSVSPSRMMTSGATNSNRRRGQGHDKFPLDVFLTPFHLAMVFYDRIRILCTVSQQLVFEDAYDQVFPLPFCHATCS